MAITFKDRELGKYKLVCYDGREFTFKLPKYQAKELANSIHVPDTSIVLYEDGDFSLFIRVSDIRYFYKLED